MKLNEGLEKLGETVVIDGEELEGNAFTGTAIESIRLPSTLKIIKTETFCSCKNL